jgi:hypothetical protein
MLSLIIWWAGFLFEFLILLRASQRKILHVYPFFYSYIAGVLVSVATLYLVYFLIPASYGKWYWAMEIPTLLLGCGIILEVLKHVLSPYPGAERFARIGGLIVFASIFAIAIFYRPISVGHSMAAKIEDLERDLRAVQAIFLVGIIGVISYYAIPLGKNLKGMIFGYVLYIGTSLANLALRSYAGMPVRAVWNAIQPFSYDISLAIWVVALWSYHPNPVPSLSVQLEADYEGFALRTRRAVGGMRSYLARAARS